MILVQIQSFKLFYCEYFLDVINLFFYVLCFKNFLDRPQPIKIRNSYDKFALIIPDLKSEVKTKFLFVRSIAKIDLLVAHRVFFE